jgi:hypothetical protein
MIRACAFAVQRSVYPSGQVDERNDSQNVQLPTFCPLKQAPSTVFRNAQDESIVPIESDADNG